MNEDKTHSQNSSSEPSFIRVFNEVTDPRSETSVNYRHPLSTILFIKDIGVKEEGEVVSFDGKTMRGTSASEKGLKAIHMLNAWSHDQGICL